MTLAASVVIDRAEKTLLDDTNVLWSAAELLDYLNAGISAVVANKPDVSVTVANFTLVNNQAKQTIPSDGLQLLEIKRNVSPATSIIRQVEENHLNHILSTWMNTSGTPAHYTYDKRVPKVFFIFPQPTSGFNIIEMTYSSIPARLTSVSDNIPIDDIYENALYYWVLAHAYAKNAKRGDLIKSQGYLSLFNASIGARQGAQFAYSPVTPDESLRTRMGTAKVNLGGPQE